MDDAVHSTSSYWRSFLSHIVTEATAIKERVDPSITDHKEGRVGWAFSCIKFIGGGGLLHLFILYRRSTRQPSPAGRGEGRGIERDCGRSRGYGGGCHGGRRADADGSGCYWADFVFALGLLCCFYLENMYSG